MSKKSDKLPAMFLYPGDWLKNPGIQSLSYHDWGVWLRMKFMMHESPQRGFLLYPNGNPMSDQDIAAAMGLPMEDQIVNGYKLRGMKNSLEELIDQKGIGSRDARTGAIYDSEMVHSERVRTVRRKCGSMGGNPSLVNQKATKGLTSTLTSRLEGGVNQMLEDEDEIEKEVKKKGRRNSSRKDVSRESIKLAEELKSRILTRDSSSKVSRMNGNSILGWALHIDRLIRIDGRQYDEILKVIIWCQKPACFWGPNILSGKKLREKYETLRGQMAREVNSFDRRGKGYDASKYDKIKIHKSG